MPILQRDNSKNLGTYPETAAIALARAARYRQWRERPETAPPRFTDVRRDEGAAIVATALSRGDGWLTAEEIAELFSCYGLPLIEQRIVKTPEEAGQVAAQMDCEVALTVRYPTLQRFLSSRRARPASRRFTQDNFPFWAKNARARRVAR